MLALTVSSLTAFPSGFRDFLRSREPALEGEWFEAKSLNAPQDHLGSVRVLTDEDGGVTERTSWGPWGERLEGGERSRFGYTGHQREESSGLHYSVHRFLDPRNGRWTRRDPLGDVDGHNRYRYSGNRPIVAVDITGLLYRLRAGTIVPPKFRELSSLGYPQFQSFYDKRNLEGCTKNRLDITAWVDDVSPHQTGSVEHLARTFAYEGVQVTEIELGQAIAAQQLDTYGLSAILAHEITHAALDIGGDAAQGRSSLQINEPRAYAVEARILRKLIGGLNPGQLKSPSGKAAKDRYEGIIEAYGRRPEFNGIFFEDAGFTSLLNSIQLSGEWQ